MRYFPYGPFDVHRPIASTGERWKCDFWAGVEKRCEDLSKSNGVYIFSLRHGARSRPWYIGKTCSKLGFKGEIFQSHKLDVYRECVKGRRGIPQIHLIAKIEEFRENFCRPSDISSRQIDQLETHLIGMCLSKNVDLKNDKKTSFHRTLEVAGVMSLGEPYLGARTADARTLRRVLGLVTD